MRNAPGIAWGITASLAAAFGLAAAAPVGRADDGGGPSATAVALWIPAGTYSDPLALDHRLPDDRTYARHRAGRSAQADAEPRPFRTMGLTAPRSFDSPILAAHPLGWTDFAAPAVPVMPAYQVNDTRLPAIVPRELYTREGMIYESFQSHPGMALTNVFGTNNNAAYETYLEDDWNRTKTDYYRTAFTMAVGGDPAEGKRIVQEVDAEDQRMRAETDASGNVPENGQFQFGSQNGDSKVLEIIPIFPVNVPLLSVKW